MKLLITILPFLAQSQNITPDNWDIVPLSLNCGFTDNSVLEFDVYPRNAKIDETSFTAGQNCKWSDMTVTTSEEELAGLEKMRYRLSYNPHHCSGVPAQPENINSYSSDTRFTIDLGQELQNVHMHFRTFIIPALCTFKSHYDLSFDFGSISKDVTDTDGTQLQGLSGGVEFDLKAYTHIDRTDSYLLTSGNSGISSSQMVYFSISPRSTIPAGLQFAPPKCIFTQESCDDQNVCQEPAHTFQLFNYEDNNIGCTSNVDAPIRFDISYDQTQKHWNSQFRVFLFGTDDDQSRFFLKCDVELCSCNAGNKCTTVADVCLADAEADVFKNQCTA